MALRGVAIRKNQRRQHRRGAFAAGTRGAGMLRDRHVAFAERIERRIGGANASVFASGNRGARRAARSFTAAVGGYRKLLANEATSTSGSAGCQSAVSGNLTETSAQSVARPRFMTKRFVAAGCRDQQAGSLRSP